MAKNIVYRLEHSAIFPDENDATVEKYLNGISRDILLKTGAYLAGFDKKNPAVRDNAAVLSKWFNAENNDFANDVYKKITQLDKKYRRETIILNIHTTLKLLERGFHLKGDDNLPNVEIEKRIFKAYLLLNELDNNKDNDILKSLEKQDKSIQWPLMVLVQSFRYADISTPNYREVFDEQIVKAVQFFLFLEKNYKSELNYFLDVYGCQTWQEYLRRAFGILKAAANHQTGFTDISVREQHDIEFIKKFSFTDESDEIKEQDFIALRAKPLFLVEPDRFRIIFDLFVFEKVFNGIFFVLRAMPGMSFNRVQDIFTFQFSEKVLLYLVLGHIYPYKIKQFSGFFLDKKKVKGAPDYYVRKKRKILLFESKAVVLNSSLKESTSFTVYEAEIKKKLYFDIQDGVIKKKAILQLIDTIKKILSDSLEFDKKTKDVKIYPIIIVHNRQLNVAGLNHLLNHWFQTELKKLEAEGLRIKRVAPVTLVNIATLLFYADNFKEKKYSLERLIEEYHRASRLDVSIDPANLENELMQRIYPFSMFVKRKIKRNGKSSILTRSIKQIVQR